MRRPHSGGDVRHLASAGYGSGGHNARADGADPLPLARRAQRYSVITRAVCPILVGREAEVGRLEDALLSACRGEGNVVVLAGAAGMGRTRLGAELTHRAHTS